MAINTSKIAQNHSIIAIFTKGYEGNRSIRKEEIATLLPGVDEKAINHKVVKPGNKKLYNPQLLNDGDNIKNKAISLLEKVGVRHTTRGGLNFIVANDKLDEVLCELETIQSDFFDWVNSRFSDTQYQQDLDEWVNENPESEKIIRAASPTAGQVRSRFVFEIGVDDIAASSNTSQSERVREAKEKTEQRLVGSLGDKLIAEVAQIAKRTLDKSVDGKAKLTRKVLSPAKTISSKLKALAMLSPFAQPLAAHIDKQVEIASEGTKPLTSAQVATVVALYQMLSNPEQIEFMFNNSKLTGGDESEAEADSSDSQAELIELLEQPIEGAQDVSQEAEVPEKEMSVEQITELEFAEETIDADKAEVVEAVTPTLEIEIDAAETAPAETVNSIDELDISGLF